MAAFRKHTTVRLILDDPAYGERFLVTGKTRTHKGTKQTELKNLRTGYVSGWEDAAEKFAAEHALPITELNRLDQVVAERVTRERQLAEAYQAQRQLEREQAVRAREAEDRVWADSLPFDFGERAYTIDQSSRHEVRVEGPDKLDRQGNQYTDYLKVEVEVRRGGTFSLPNDYVKREVNWFAIGSVSPAVARAYARAILFAAHLAEQLEVPVATTEVSDV